MEVTHEPQEGTRTVHNIIVFTFDLARISLLLVYFEAETALAFTLYSNPPEHILPTMLFDCVKFWHLSLSNMNATIFVATSKIPLILPNIKQCKIFPQKALVQIQNIVLA